MPPSATGVTKLIQPSAGRGVSVARAHQPEQVHEAHRDDEHRDQRHDGLASLQVAIQQEQERQREVPEDEQRAQIHPARPRSRVR